MSEERPQPPAGGRFRMIDVDGRRIRAFVREGADETPPLLICNGLGQAIEILFPLIEELAQRPVVAFDAVGVGRSSTPDRMLSIADHAALTRKMLRRLGVARYDALGISWGGCLAQQLAHDDPEGCRKLVLAIASAGGIGSWWGTPVAMSEIFFPLRYASPAYRDFIGPAMYGGEALQRPDLFREYAKHSVAPSAMGYFGQVAAMCSWTSLGWLHRVAQPTQVISGLCDGMIPAANQFLLAQRLPDAELKLFAAGHLVMYSQREEVAAMIGAFLDRGREGADMNAEGGAS